MAAAATTLRSLRRLRADDACKRQLLAIAAADPQCVRRPRISLLGGAQSNSEVETFKQAILAPPAGERSAWTAPLCHGRTTAMTDLRAALIIIALPEMAG